MNTTALKQMLLPLIILFVVMNIIFLIFGNWLDAHNFSHSLLLYANILFFILGLIITFIHIRALQNSNAYAFVRSIMLSSFLKLIVIAAAVLIYLLRAGERRNIYSIITAMVIYIFYTVIEVKAAMRLNKIRNVKN